MFLEDIPVNVPRFGLASLLMNRFESKLGWVRTTLLANEKRLTFDLREEQPRVLRAPDLRSGSATGEKATTMCWKLLSLLLFLNDRL